MENESKLARLLRESSLVAEMRDLKRILEERPEMRESFEKILALQRAQVRAEAAENLSRAREAESSRESEMARLTAFPAVSRYLDDCGELQELMNEIQDILRDGLGTR